MEEHISPRRKDAPTATFQNNNNNKNTITTSHNSAAASATADSPTNSTNTAGVTTESTTTESSSSSSSCLGKDNHKPAAIQSMADATNETSPFSVPNASPIPTLAATTVTDSQQQQQQQQQDGMQPEPIGQTQTTPVWKFPSHIDPPSKELIRFLHEQAMAEGVAVSGDESDQTELSRYGILSFEDVLLLASAHQHNQALKHMQSRLQRDHPDCVYQVTSARCVLYNVTKQARQAAQTARRHRQQTIVPALQQEKALAKEQARKRDEAYQALRRLTRQRELKKKFVPNQEMWREVAYLVTELQKLEKEERTWKQAEKELDRKLEKNHVGDCDDMDITSDHENDEDCLDDCKENAISIMEDASEPQSPPLESKRPLVLQQVRQIQLQCTTIEESLEILQSAMERTQSLQRQVAQTHDQNRFFVVGGYSCNSSRNSRGGGGEGSQTKDLIRIMSQEDPSG